MNPKIMSIEQSKAMLIEMGERCLRLADDLGHGGRRLTRDENALLRSAYLPVVEEHLTLMKVGYVTGDREMIERSTDTVHDIFRGTQLAPPPDKNHKK